MKKLVQLVAAVLLLSVPAQPMLAANSCDRPACNSHPSMDCCDHAGSMAMSSQTMPMGMHCGQPGITGPASPRCMDDGCCAVSVRPAPPASSPRTAALGAAHAFRSAIRLQRAPERTLSAIAPPGPTAPRTARYILFHDLRI